MAGDDGSDHNQTPSNSDPNHPQNRSSCPHDDNPFVFFRRFADEQISSMLQSVMGLPSIVSPPQPDHWAVFNESHNYNVARHREDDASPSGGGGPSGDSQSPTNPNDKDNDKHTCTKSSQRSESSDPWHRHNRRRVDTSFPDFFGIGSFFDRFWLDERLPLSSRIFPSGSFFGGMLDGDEDMPLWPALYIMTSPYSPLQLEREARYRAHREDNQGVFSSLISSLKPSSETDQSYYRDPAEPEWRDAFEDLLRVKYGKPMLDRESEPTEERQSDKDWFTGLVQRGSLGDGWKYAPSKSTIWYSNQPEKEQEGENEYAKIDKMDNSVKINGIGIHGMCAEQADPEQADPTTELDLYERFIRDIEAREQEFSRQFYDSPILRFLSDERERLKEEIAAYRSQLAQKDKEGQDRSRDAESWIDLVSGGHKNTVSDSADEKLSPSDPQSTEPEQPRQPYVVSTSTTIERVHRTDGSIHKKTVRTQRFSDGREESDESVETVNPPRVNAPDSSPAQEPPAKDDSSGGGWFWSR